jgi:aryl-alcohol dehydrogenase-like predicted oxidoreductase
MRSRRTEVFLATKVNRRSKQGVLDEIKESLRRLQTDHVDLIQIHAVNALGGQNVTVRSVVAMSRATSGGVTHRAPARRARSASVASRATAQAFQT